MSRKRALSMLLVAACATSAVLVTVPRAAAEPVEGPPMGWNSWNSGIPLSESTVEATIDAMVNSGMRDVGYRYVNLDAGWAAPQRDAAGRLAADPAKFPHGIAALARYAHDRGMRFGLYASPYNETCGQSPAIASVGHEDTDARTFAAWGVDFLKYDWCRAEANRAEQIRVFTRMRDALTSTGRRIVYSINPNSSDALDAARGYDWSRVADMTRVAHDLYPLWRNTSAPVTIGGFDSRQYLGVVDELAAAGASGPGGGSAASPRRAQGAPRSSTAAGASGPGGGSAASPQFHWNDPDMLIVGVDPAQFLGAHLGFVPNSLVKMLPLTVPQQIAARDVVKRATTGVRLTPAQIGALAAVAPPLTIAEQRAHFSLWAMLAAPLIAGNDVRTMSAQIAAILLNREVIAVDQDPAATQGTFLPGDDRIMVKRLADGSVAVALLNRSRRSADIATTAHAVGLPAARCYTVRDLWSHRSRTTTDAVAGNDIPAHGVAMFRVAARC